MRAPESPETKHLFSLLRAQQTRRTCGLTSGFWATEAWGTENDGAAVQNPDGETTPVETLASMVAGGGGETVVGADRPLGSTRIIGAHPALPPLPYRALRYITCARGSFGLTEPTVIRPM